MSKVRHDFKRVLLRLPHSAKDYAAVTLIAELAGRLGADLIGTYVEDGDIRNLVELPGAREFRAGAWQPLQSGQLTLDLASAAWQAERLFLQRAGRYRHSFQVVNSASAATHEAGSDDIIVVIEPKSAIERATHQFNELLEHAYRSKSSILWVPGEAKHLTGPVVVVARGPNDPCIPAAVSIAASVKERIILIPENSSGVSFSAALDQANAVGVTTTLSEAVFHQDDLLLPPHIKAGLFVTGREREIGRLRLLQTPLLLVAGNRAATS